MNILRVVGFHDVDSALTSTLTGGKLRVKFIDSHGDDGWLTMHQFKLCCDILDQNPKSAIEAFKVTNYRFRWCVSCLCLIFCNFKLHFFPSPSCNKNSILRTLIMPYGMKCEKCAFRNKPHAFCCKICGIYLEKEYFTQMQEWSDFLKYISTGDYQSCKKYLESCEKQGAATLSTIINCADWGIVTPILAACYKNNIE